MIKLIIVFGVLMNPANITYTKAPLSGDGCIVFFNHLHSVRFKSKTCTTIDDEIMRQLELLEMENQND